MLYLKEKDIESLIVSRFIDESSQEDQQIIDELEMQNIELIKSYLRSRYDVDAIFHAEQPVLHPILIRILSKFVLFDVIRRNAARKIPTDFIEEYDKAMALLEKISTGRMPLVDLPSATNTSTTSEMIWGNNRNTDFYI